MIISEDYGAFCENCAMVIKNILKTSVYGLGRIAVISVLMVVWWGGVVAVGKAGTFTWNNSTGNWSVAANWGGVGPTGMDPTTGLIFGGDVGSVVGSGPNYVATEDFLGAPFLLNQLVFKATDEGNTGVDQTLSVASGSRGLRLVRSGGTGPVVMQDGAGGITLDLPLELVGGVAFGGNGLGEVTMNHAVTGAADVVKNGTGTMRFGTPFNSTTFPATGPSANTWVGKLTINDGVVRFNNNADAGRTALRSNAVVLNALGASLTCNAEIRCGTLSGLAGNVQTIVVGSNGSSGSIVIEALSSGEYGGTLRIDPRTGSGSNTGVLTVRGVGTQTLSGIVSLNVVGGDITVGRGATLVLAGTASLGADSKGAVVLNGGTFQLDNRLVGNGNRLREGGVDSTGLETIGGGTFSLIGNVAGSMETVGRLQLGSVNNSLTTSTPRAGALTVNITGHSVVAPTVLTFQSYTRDARDLGLNQTTTVNFKATTGVGTAISLGGVGSSGRVTFGNLFVVPLLNGLMDNTSAGIGSPAGRHDVGWATVTTGDGLDFATYLTAVDSGFARGVVALGSTEDLPASADDFTKNVRLAGNGTVSSASDYRLSSLRIVPSGVGQHLEITGAGNLATTAFILSNDPTLGAVDYLIQNGGLGVGKIAGSGPRYFQVQEGVLSVGVSLAGADQPVVKAGEGALVLTGDNAVGVTQAVVINAGTLRATPGTSLPSGEMRLRGGVLEIVGGGTFHRTIGGSSTGTAINTVNWSGISGANTAIAEDRGSGGFAAVGAELIIDLNTLGVADFLAWEGKGFINSGHALTFGSTRATHRVIWTDHLALNNALDATVNYNAREIRVVDNAAVSTDSARISGVISGTVQNDLLKTGSGTLELTGANTYLGNTMIEEGVLSISAAGNLGATSGSNALVINGGTLRVTAAGVLLPAERAVSVGAPGATLEVDAGADLTIAGDISGGGATLNKAGAGALTLNGVQSYGTLNVAAGTAWVSGLIGDGGSTVEVGGGANLKFGGISQTLAGLSIGAGATVTFASGLGSLNVGAGESKSLGINAIPEPSASLFLALGAIFGGFWSRRGVRVTD